MNDQNFEAIVIGAGPAGLMAAEMLADAGHKTAILESNPTAGRKLLMAGKSGLNLTKDEPFKTFLGSYGRSADWLKPMLKDFASQAVQDWAQELGQEVFTGSSKRVFPKAMKSSGLLRAWLKRLESKGVVLLTRWNWIGIEDGNMLFDTPDGPKTLQPSATILALGGASWSRLGSNGQWVDILAAKDIEITPFQPANMGFVVNWSKHMERHFGKPVKTCQLTSGKTIVRGEFVVSSKGLEGGGIYAVSTEMRAGRPLIIDLLPDLSSSEISRRIDKPRGKNSLANHLRKTLKLDPVRLALLQEFAHPLPQDADALTKILKSLPIKHDGPRPLDEAISTAGGIAQTALTNGLMLRKLPGVFAAGEMLDWEAPTGGYLLNACFATGRRAGQGAARYLAKLGETA